MSKSSGQPEMAEGPAVLSAGPIVTLTINPAIDVGTETPLVVGERKLRCARPRYEAGGGGINVARAIHKLGGEALAVYTSGGPPGTMLGDYLDTESVPHIAVPTEGWTRENFAILERSTLRQFRFGMPGPELHRAEVETLLRTLAELEPAPRFLVASGSLPPGCDPGFYGRVVEIGERLGARVLVDTSGEPLRKAAESGAALLKPNLAELQDLVGEELPDDEAIVEAARDLLRRGSHEAIVVSLGASGALMVTADLADRVVSPTVPIRSRVGAGDSMVAGLILALARGLAMRDAVRFGVASGSAAAMTSGTELCRREDAERLYARMPSRP